MTGLLSSFFGRASAPCLVRIRRRHCGSAGEALTLADGEVIRSAVVPPFVFSGRGGNSRYLTPSDWKNFEPRFGFAWAPSFLGSRHVTLRGGYGVSHVPVTGSFRLPQPDFGATSAFATTAPSATANPQYVMRLG